MPQARLESIQVGLPERHGHAGAEETHDQPWFSGIFKAPVQGRIFVSHTNLDGDGQADLKHHGGPDKAVLAYSADHYPLWQSELNRTDLPHGIFGENLTISAQSEDSVNIGDRYAIGGAIFEVSQPRQPCWKLARRFRLNDMIAFVVANARGGWYLRVIQEGYIESSQPVTLLERPNPDWSILRAHRVLYGEDAAQMLELASLPQLAESWVRQLRQRAAGLLAPLNS